MSNLRNSKAFPKLEVIKRLIFSLLSLAPVFLLLSVSVHPFMKQNVEQFLQNGKMFTKYL